MYCTGCGQPLDEDAAFCTSCGRPVAGPAADQPLPASSSVASPSSTLTSASQLTIVWDKLSMMTNFQFQDPSGHLLGSTRGEVVFPLKYTLLDANEQPVLVLDAVRVRGLLYEYQIHEPNGNVLASIHQDSSFMSRKYTLSVAGRPDWLLTTDAGGYHYQIEAVSGGNVVATGDRKPALRTSTTEIRITDGQPLDHRIILGSMILVYYLTTRK